MAVLLVRGVPNARRPPALLRSRVLMKRASPGILKKVWNEDEGVNACEMGKREGSDRVGAKAHRWG